ncbi:MAG TPA: rhodanese-like domain-containing protein [Chloroflexota bacterium]|jgi:glyoxylase-like metal-dependent hydrolase (beta-lactamase superfamily II)/rhodanese-related sulfurtransferase|nr:rhodanese-like domain-containing protein [Chloroflexota bacterium]
MFFEQIVHSDLGCASYVLASTETREAMVVDPRWEIEPYLDLAKRHGFDITRIVETHNHADHVSGHGRLAAATGATILIHEAAGVGYPHHALADGEVITLGDLRVHIIHTPGHRPEHIALAIEDVSRGSDPWMVLTGDSLFIGDVARPDLAVEATDGAMQLFDSLHERILRLPDFVAVYPAHVAGSLCGRVSSEVHSSTIGYERRYNQSLAIEERDSFVHHMTQNLPHRPPNMGRIVAENRGPLRTDPVQIHTLNVEEAAEMIASGAIPFDVRATVDYLTAHIPASIHVPISGGQFGTRAGFVVPGDVPIVLVAANPKEVDLAATSLRAVAYENVAGFLQLEHWIAKGREVVSIDSVSVADLNQMLGDGVTVLDVREPDEFQTSSVSGALNIPYPVLPARLAEVPSNGLVAVICGSGSRSAISASLLERAGRWPVANVQGGMTAWETAGLPVK